MAYKHLTLFESVVYGFLYNKILALRSCWCTAIKTNIYFEGLQNILFARVLFIYNPITSMFGKTIALILKCYITCYVTIYLMLKCLCGDYFSCVCSEIKVKKYVISNSKLLLFPSFLLFSGISLIYIWISRI